VFPMAFSTFSAPPRAASPFVTSLCPFPRWCSSFFEAMKFSAALIFVGPAYLWQESLFPISPIGVLPNALGPCSLFEQGSLPLVALFPLTGEEEEFFFPPSMPLKRTYFMDPFSTQAIGLDRPINPFDVSDGILGVFSSGALRQSGILPFPYSKRPLYCPRPLPSICLSPCHLFPRETAISRCLLGSFSKKQRHLTCPFPCNPLIASVPWSPLKFLLIFFHPPPDVALPRPSPPPFSRREFPPLLFVVDQKSVHHHNPGKSPTGTTTAPRKKS